MVVVLLVGYTASGKTGLGKALLNKRKEFHQVLDISDIVKKFSNDGTDIIGNDKFYNKVLSLISDGTIVTGVREMKLLNYIINKFSDSVLFKLHSSDSVRYDRFVQNGGTIEQFIKKDIQERQIGLTEIMLSNIGTFVSSQQGFKKNNFESTLTELCIGLDCRGNKK